MAKPKKRKGWSSLTPEGRAAAQAQSYAKSLKRSETYNPVAAARSAWRREFSRSPAVVCMMLDPATKRYVPAYKQDGSRAANDAVEHLCNVCHQWKRSTKKSKVAIDHIIPVVDPSVEFSGDFTEYFRRMWCAKENLQKICGDCHALKTNAEWRERWTREAMEIIAGLEASDDQQLIRKSLKSSRFSRKRCAELAYSEDLLKRIAALRARLLK